MIEIVSNGSKWYGQKPDNIEILLNVLTNYPLDKRIFNGNYIYKYTTENTRKIGRKYLGCTCFHGNFYDISHVFQIITDEQDTIELLTNAINNNIKRFENIRYLKINKDFLSKSKIDKDFRHYKYVGKDKNNTSYNIIIQEVKTGELSNVEPEWFRQRKIKWL